MYDQKQHILNDAHIYCRLRDCRVPKTLAKWMCKTLAGFLRPFLYGRKSMNGAKPFYLSTGVLGCSTGAAGTLGALIAALAALKGLEIGPESQVLILTLFVSFGGAVAGLIGRIKANTSIGRPPQYASGGTIKGESIPDTLAPLAGSISSEILHTSGPGLAEVLDKLADVMAALNAQRERDAIPFESSDGQSGQPTVQPSNP